LLKAQAISRFSSFLSITLFVNLGLGGTNKYFSLMIFLFL